MTGYSTSSNLPPIVPRQNRHFDFVPLAVSGIARYIICRAQPTVFRYLSLPWSWRRKHAAFLYGYLWSSVLQSMAKRAWKAQSHRAMIARAV